MKNKNLNKAERSLLGDIFHSFLDHTGWGDNDLQEANALIDEILMARYITLTYHDVVVVEGNEMHSRTIPLDEFMQRYND